MSDTTLPPLLNLPAELIHHVLSFLSPFDLAHISAVSQLLREHSLSDQLWQPQVQSHVPNTTLKKPLSLSWKDIYTTHHPYWFLAKHKIWFGDNQHSGKLLIARYDDRLPAIEAYALVAERRQPTLALWSWNPDVMIHTFSPRVKLDLNVPILRLDAPSCSHAVGDGPSRLSKEIPMNVHDSSHNQFQLVPQTGLFSRFMLSRSLPPSVITPATSVWPPHIIPALERTRNESSNKFRGTGHRPSSLSEVSDQTFRLRRWMEFSSRNGINMRVGEDVTTYSTLPEACYTPTEQKPWQGIWCGDYAGHGCEFLLITQPDDPLPLPELAEYELSHRSPSGSSDGSWSTAPTENAPDDETSTASDSPEDPFWGGVKEIMDPSSQDNETDGHSNDEGIYKGRIEAIKLTGDANVPRGEYTFIAPDIGPKGLLRIANEDIFKGARIVRSVGHIAAEGFRDDQYILSQLILISHNRLAQYWETFGHVSFYERVDIEQFTRVT